MGRMNTGSMESDRADHKHCENEPSPAWNQVEAAGSNRYWVSKDRDTNVKQITIPNPTQSVAGVLMSNEPSLDASSTSRLFQNHFKGGNFLGFRNVTSCDENVVVDVHILFVRLHTSKPALPTGPVGTSASDFIPLRPHDYQLSIQLIDHSDGS